MDVVKDVVSVESAKNEEPRVGKERSMIAPWSWGSAEGRSGLVLQGNYIAGLIILPQRGIVSKVK